MHRNKYNVQVIYRSNKGGVSLVFMAHGSAGLTCEANFLTRKEAVSFT